MSTGLELLSGRLEALEGRYAHQEAALEELTRTVLAQEQRIREQAEQLQRLERQVRALQGGADSLPADERPPHY
jgi:uncharacterized coiled-coil protein SlyX